MVKKYVLNNVVKASDLRDARPVWNNAKRVNHQNFSNKWTHPHSKRKFVPSAVLANSGKISINTAKPVAPKPTMNVFNQRSNIFHKSHSLVKRPFHQRTVHKNSASTERVNTGKVNVTIVGNKAVVSTIQGNKVNVVKALTCWTWRPKPNVIDHVSKDNNRSWICKGFEYFDPQGINKSNLEIIGYQIGLESLEARLVVHEKNEAVYEEDIAFLKYDVQVKDISIKDLKNQLEEALKEKDDLKLKLEKIEESSKNLNNLINSQISAKGKAGLGYDCQINLSEVVHSVV
ncbi:hypothetical protein Tco_0780357 [Tanacetum coccineum]